MLILYGKNHMFCCIIGHRKIEITDRLVLNVKEKINFLILQGVDTFLFGSNSEFDKLCYKIVSELKNTKFPNIKRVKYTCVGDFAIIDQNFRQKALEAVKFNEDSFPLYESEVEHKNKYCAGRASYLERNYAMIDASDYCLFYYNKNYKPPMRKFNKRDVFAYQPNSGTKMAYKYAIKKNKKVINIFSS